LVVLALLWLFAASPIGLSSGYLPPRFKPQWLYHVVLSSIFAIWIALGIVQMIFNGQELAWVIVGVIAILTGLGGLGFMLAQAGQAVGTR
jgi:hypothetical protein